MTKHSLLIAAALALATAGPLLAAQPRPAPPPPASGAVRIAPPSAVPVAPLDERGARDTREWLNKVLEQYPPSVRDVLRIDPSLLSRPDYLATYPTLAAFLEQHPEVAHNPAYFVGSADLRGDDGRAPDARIEAIRAWRNLGEFLPVVAIVFIITSALAGVIRTLLDQRRWRRASQMQMDMQNKLIDRFAGNNELLAYLQSPTGRGLSEMGGPISASISPRVIDAPISRIFWPLQTGIVLTAAGIGLHFLGSRIGFAEMSEPVTGLGALVAAIGVGFIVSAAATYLLSHRLGLVSVPPPPGFHRETPGA